MKKVQPIPMTVFGGVLPRLSAFPPVPAFAAGLRILQTLHADPIQVTGFVKD
jgi:hypothetical protein